MIAGERSSIWRSATLWTWASTGARVLAIGSTLPVVATAFPDNEAALWYLFLTIASLQLVADLSFSSVFGRFVAYAVGGAQSLGDQKIPESAATSRGPNVALLHAIYATSHPVYAFVVAAWIIGAGAFGAWSAGDLIREAQQPTAAAIALGAVVAATGVRLYSNRYTAILFGLSEFFIWRRFEAFAWLTATVLGVACVLRGYGLLVLTVVFFGCVAGSCVMYRVLALRSLLRLGGIGDVQSVDRDVLQEVLPRAWRGGIGVLLHVGTMHALTASVARLEPAATAASYLLAYNVARAIDQLAQAPFYTKLPVLSRLRAQGSDGVRTLAASGMRSTYWVLAIGLSAAALTAEPVLGAIGSNTRFVDGSIWAVLAASMFFERYGATHLQAFMTTNRVVVHVANGIAGFIMLGLAFPLYRQLGLVGIPLAGLIANALWYAPYGAAKSRSVIGGDVLRFEARTSLGPAALLVVSLVVSALVYSPS